MIEKPNYTQIPNVYFDSIMQKLNGSENLVFLAIMRKTFGWRKKKDRISYSQIMEMTGLAKSTTAAALKSLEMMGYISSEKTGQSFSYYVNIEDETVPKIEPVRKSNCTENRTSAVPKIEPVFDETVPKIEHTKEKGLNKDLKKGENENQFMIFYQNYPKKTNKTDARKTFNKLIKSGVSLDSILSKLTIYKKQIEKDQTDIKYIKNPQRFLNCLEDYEIEEEKNPVSEKRICPACGSALSGLFCKTCFTQYNEKMEATF